MPAANKETGSVPQCTCLSGGNPAASSWLTRVRRRLSGQSEPERLSTDIDALEALAANYRQGGWPKVEFGELLTRARCHARRGDVASGYELLHIAERHSIYGMPELELEARTVSLQHEIGKKLKGYWRGGASTELLKAAKPDPSLLARAIDALRTEPKDRRAALAEAVAHRNTHDRNSHRKTDQLRMQVFVIGVLLLLEVLGFVAVAMGWWELPPTGKGNRRFVECVALGLLGGTLSSAMFINGFDRTRAFQEMDSAWTISLARAFIGCATSIPVYLVASAKWITIGGTLADPYGIQFLCFAAGFSERWFLHLVPVSPPASQPEAAVKVASAGVETVKLKVN